MGIYEILLMSTLILTGFWNQFLTGSGPKIWVSQDKMVSQNNQRQIDLTKATIRQMYLTKLCYQTVSQKNCKTSRSYTLINEPKNTKYRLKLNFSITFCLPYIQNFRHYHLHAFARGYRLNVFQSCLGWNLIGAAGFNFVRHGS